MLRRPSWVFFRRRVIQEAIQAYNTVLQPFKMIRYEKITAFDVGYLAYF